MYCFDDANEYDGPVWQLPGKGDGASTGSDLRLKYHCFYKGVSLCGRYKKRTRDNLDEIGMGEILSSPELVCRSCFQRWLDRFF